MSNAADLRRLALALPHTVEQPHFQRAAFKADRIYVTLAEDQKTANFKFTPAEQEFKCQLAPDIFQPLNNGWGRQGWTVCQLAAASEADLSAALLMAYQHGRGKHVSSL